MVHRKKVCWIGKACISKTFFFEWAGSPVSKVTLGLPGTPGSKPEIWFMREREREREREVEKGGESTRATGSRGG